LILQSVGGRAGVEILRVVGKSGQGKILGCAQRPIQIQIGRLAAGRGILDGTVQSIAVAIVEDREAGSGIVGQIDLVHGKRQWPVGSVARVDEVVFSSHVRGHSSWMKPISVVAAWLETGDSHWIT